MTEDIRSIYSSTLDIKVHPLVATSHVVAAHTDYVRFDKKNEARIPLPQ